MANLTNKTFKDFSVKLLSSLCPPRFVPVHECIPLQLEGLAFHFVELKKISVDPFLEPLKAAVNMNAGLQLAFQVTLLCKEASPWTQIKKKISNHIHYKDQN